MKNIAIIVVASLGACGVVGCTSKDATPVQATTAVEFNSAGAPTIEFSVPDMMCADSCVPQVRKILAAQPGVKDVKVELETKTATVAVDMDTFDPNAAVAALVDVQFKNTTLKTPSAAMGDGGETSDSPSTDDPTAPMTPAQS